MQGIYFNEGCTYNLYGPDGLETFEARYGRGFYCDECPNNIGPNWIFLSSTSRNYDLCLTCAKKTTSATMAYDRTRNGGKRGRRSLARWWLG